MNGLNLSELCCLFCCPPFPGKIGLFFCCFFSLRENKVFLYIHVDMWVIERLSDVLCFSLLSASKLAFLPPECSYDLKADENSSTKFKMTLLEKADWQYGDREKELFESFFVRSSRGNRIACLFVRCSTNARWVFCIFLFEEKKIFLLRSNRFIFPIHINVWTEQSDSYVLLATATKTNKTWNDKHINKTAHTNLRRRKKHFFFFSLSQSFTYIYRTSVYWKSKINYDQHNPPLPPYSITNSLWK